MVLRCPPPGAQRAGRELRSSYSSNNICIKNGFLPERPKALLKGLRVQCGVETGDAAKIGRNPLIRTLRYRRRGDAQAAAINIQSFSVITLPSIIVIVLTTMRLASNVVPSSAHGSQSGEGIDDAQPIAAPLR